MVQFTRMVIIEQLPTVINYHKQIVATCHAIQSSETHTHLIEVQTQLISFVSVLYLHPLKKYNTLTIEVHNIYLIMNIIFCDNYNMLR